MMLVNLDMMLVNEENRRSRAGAAGSPSRRRYLFSIAMRWASAPLWAPATLTVSTPAS